MLRIPIDHPLAGLSIECTGGGRLSLRIESVATSLTIEQWGAVRSAIDEAWRDLDILCTCGDSFVCHSGRSPHACYAERGCPCRIFTAAEPLYLEEASE
jgi:hypothetical protein